jgi:Ni2+-binding GTPase involved in maturation of urease and hydrogenase
MLNPGLITFTTSAKTGDGMQPWLDWLLSKCQGQP